MRAMSPATPEELEQALREHSYLADRGLAVSIFLAMRMGRPLLLEGEPGVGKTEVARTLARIAGAELIRLQCHEGIDAAQEKTERYRSLLSELASTGASSSSETASDLPEGLKQAIDAWTGTRP